MTATLEPPQPTRLLLVDLDNTLYNWVAYFAPAFRSMVHLLAREVKLSEAQITQQFADIYSSVGTTEYPFTVQRLPCLQDRNPEEVLRLATWCRIAFGRSRKKHLLPYDGVSATLRWASVSGIKIWVVTSAPRYVVYSKLRSLGLLSIVDHLVAWEGFSAPDDPAAMSLRRSSDVEHVPTTSLQKDCFRPKTQALKEALFESGIDPDEAAVVGDSLWADMLPARELGLKPYWARYGLVFSARDRETIVSITPGGKQTVQLAYADHPVPDGVLPLEDFKALTMMLAPPQTSFF